MLTLTARQMAAGEHGWQADRDAHIAAYLCTEYPTISPAPAPLLTPVAQARQFANDLGFSDDLHVRDVVEACFLFGPAIGNHPTFRQIIDKQVWTAADKANAIWHLIILPRRNELT